MFHARLLICCLPVWGLLLGGCTADELASQAGIGDRPIKIVVTTSMVGDLVRHVAGDRAEVIGLMGEGVDPHLYRPTSRDLGKMMDADMIFYSGLGLEGAMQTAFERISRNGKAVVPVTDQLPTDRLIMSEHFAGHPDPHVWNDPTLWAECLDRVVAVLSDANPGHAETFQAKAAAYRAEIEEMDKYARSVMATIPEPSRYLVTAHDAFAYFSRAYQLRERSVQGITTESEPGVQDINSLVDFLVKQRIPALFVEATVNSANLKAVIEGARQRGWEVNEGGMLYSDSTGAAGTYEGTYLGMLDHNVTTVVRALGGTAPARGRLGKLAPR